MKTRWQKTFLNLQKLLKLNVCNKLILQKVCILVDGGLFIACVCREYDVMTYSWCQDSKVRSLRSNLVHYGNAVQTIGQMVWINLSSVLNIDYTWKLNIVFRLKTLQRKSFGHQFTSNWVSLERSFSGNHRFYICLIFYRCIIVFFVRYVLGKMWVTSLSEASLHVIHMYFGPRAAA